MRVLQQDVSLEQHRLRRLLGGVLDDDGANIKQAEHSKSISILSPLANDDITLFHTRYPITIQKVVGVLRGSSTPSVVVNVMFDVDRSAAGTAAVNGQTISSTSAVDDLTIADATIEGNQIVWLEVPTVNGTVDELHLTIFYRTDHADAGGFSDGFSAGFAGGI